MPTSGNIRVGAGQQSGGGVGGQQLGGGSSTSKNLSSHNNYKSPKQFELKNS